MKRIQQFILVCLLTVAFIGCDNEIETLELKEERYCLDEKFKPKVEFETAVISEVQESIHLTASVETNPDKVIRFVSLMDGIISKVYFSLGDKVSKGQVLAELSSAELSSLTSELNNLSSEIAVAENHLQSVQSMFDDGIASQKDLMEAQSSLSIYKSKKGKISANLKLFSASTEKGVFKIKAPTDGIITDKTIAAGTQISAEGEPLFTISDLSEVWVMVDIYASNVQHIAKGMSLNMTTISYPDTVFKGKIAAISQVLDSKAKVLKARVVLSNPELKLKPGMLVDAVALKDQDVEAISIPTATLVFDDNQNFVVVYKDDCEMEIRKVDILSRSNGITYIAKGLSENEVIISKNQLLIYEQIKN